MLCLCRGQTWQRGLEATSGQQAHQSGSLPLLDTLREGGEEPGGKPRAGCSEVGYSVGDQPVCEGAPSGDRYALTTTWRV